MVTTDTKPTNLQLITDLRVNYVHRDEVRKTYAPVYVKTIKTRTSFLSLESRCARARAAEEAAPGTQEHHKRADTRRPRAVEIVLQMRWSDTKEWSYTESRARAKHRAAPFLGGRSARGGGHTRRLPDSPDRTGTPARGAPVPTALWMWTVDGVE